MIETHELFRYNSVQNTFVYATCSHQKLMYSFFSLQKNYKAQTFKIVLKQISLNFVILIE